MFGGDGCAGTDTLGTDAMYETNLRYGAGWVVTTVDYGVNSDGNVGKGEVGVIGASMDCGTRMARLRRGCNLFY